MSGFLISVTIAGGLVVLGCFAAIAAVVLGAQAERREERRRAELPPPADGPPLTAYERAVIERLDDGSEDKSE